MCVTEALFNDYLKTIKLPKSSEKAQVDKIRDQELTLWNQTLKQLSEQRINKSLNF